VTGRALLSLLLVLPLALVAEAAALLALLAASGPLEGARIGTMVGLHLFAATLAGEGARLRYPLGEPSAHGAWRLGLGLSLLLPGFGLLLVVVLMLRPPRVVRVKEDDFVSPMEFRKQQAEAELAAEAQKGTAGVSIETIGDALKDQDKLKRLGAVEALRALQNKEAVELLGRSLKNTVFEVRYHAVEALAGINKKYSERIAKATAALERDPGPRSERALGETYYEYASLEMEEPSIQQHLYRNAVEHLRRSLLPGEPPDPEVLLKCALSLERLGEVEAAWRSFKQTLAAFPRSSGALLGLARLQFQRAEFDQLRETCRALRALDEPALQEAQLSSVLTLWAEGAR
jgi:tetratricopeptide (TPR) repeat protein